MQGDGYTISNICYPENAELPVQSQLERSFDNIKKPLGPEKRARFERTQDILAKSGLLEITKKTALLIKSNQQAQLELQQLRAEVQELVQSVLASPANQNKSQRIVNEFINNPLDHPIGQDAVSASTKVSVIRQHNSSLLSSAF